MFFAAVALLPALLVPVALGLFDEQNLVSVLICAVVEADVGQDVGLVPVAVGESVSVLELVSFLP